MLRRIVFLCLLFSSATLCVADDLESQCTYCGSWLPIPPLKPRIPGEFFLVSRSYISFPGCDPIEAHIAVIDENIPYTPPATAALKALRAVYSSEQTPECRKSFPVKSKGFTLLLELQPRGIKNGEELIASVYERAALDKVLRADTLIDPNAPNTKSNRYHRLPSINSWWLIRWDHNPCEEGTFHGFDLCHQLSGRP